MAGSIASRARQARMGIARKQIAIDFKRISDAIRGLVHTFPAAASAHTFPITATGRWRFVLWGGGGGGKNSGTWGGGSGAFYLAERRLIAGQVVTISTGNGGPESGGNGGDTTVTLPDGEVLTAGGAQSSVSEAGGAVTANRNTDIVFPGSSGGLGTNAGANGLGGSGGAGGSGGIGGGGAGAPGFGPYRGGAGAGSNGAFRSRAPGGGGCVDGTSGNRGQDGLVLAIFLGD